MKHFVVYLFVFFCSSLCFSTPIEEHYDTVISLIDEARLITFQVSGEKYAGLIHKTEIALSQESDPEYRENVLWILSLLHFYKDTKLSFVDTVVTNPEQAVVECSHEVKLEGISALYSFLKSCSPNLFKLITSAILLDTFRSKMPEHFQQNSAMVIMLEILLDASLVYYFTKTTCDLFPAIIQSVRDFNRAQYRFELLNYYLNQPAAERVISIYLSQSQPMEQ